MKLIDIYNEYKINYKEYVIFIESGVFYNVYNNDTSILYSLYNYKIKKLSNYYLIGFPINNISNITNNLKSNNINYIILNKDDNNKYYISDRYKSNKNNYNKYNIDFNRLNYLNNRIDNIASKLNEKIFSKDIENILLNIEKLL